MANRPVHFEFYSTDVEASVKFFENAFGWDFKKWDDFDYWLAFTGPDGAGIDGGITAAPDGSPPFTMNTMEVENLEEAIAAAEQAGGTTASEPQDLPGVGRWIHIKEPGGNIFGILQPHQPEESNGEATND